MARKRYSDEDVLNLLRQIELSLASGSSIETACRSAGISDATYYNWRKRYGGIPQRHRKRKRLDHKDSSVIRLRPKYQNHIWSIDFVHDKLANGRPYKMLTVLDEYSREAQCVAVKPRMGPPQPVGISGRSFHLISAVDIAAKAGPTSWLIKYYLELDSLTQVFGPTKSYKSFLALDWGLSIATGRDWCSQTAKRGLVVYIAGEGHNGLRRRLKAWSQHHSVKPPFYVPFPDRVSGTGGRMFKA
jgi:transposase